MFLILALAALVIFTYWAHQHFDYWENKNFPHKKLNFVEKIQKLFSFNFPTTGEYRALKHNGIFGFHLSIFPAVMVTDPTIINDVLIRDFRKFFNRRVTIDPSIDPNGLNLFTMHDDEWKKARTLTSPAYVISNSKNPIAAAINICDNLMRFITERRMIEVHDLMKRVVIDFMALWVFSIKVDSINEPKNEFFEACSNGFFKDDEIVIWKSLIFMFVPSILKTFRMKTLPVEAETFFCNLVRQMGEMRKDPKNARNDFIQFLIKLKETNEDFTDVDISAHILLTFFGGLETSIATLTFGLFELTKSEEIQTRCQEEIDENTLHGEDELTFENLKNMKYLTAVVDEVLRKYSPGISVNRVCSEDTEVTEQKLKIPKGTLVYINSLKIHRDPDIYEDPMKFRPERFLTSPKGTEVPGTPYFPFGLGHHSCIGKTVAQNFIKIVFVHILGKFNLKFSSPDEESEISFKRKKIVAHPSREVVIEFVDR
jgi:cytochrome P450